MEEDFPLSYFPRCRGLTSSEQDERRKLYGENSIRIHLTPIFVLFFREVLSPFYIFQVFSCALWFYDDYYYYASCIVLLSAISIAYSLFTIRKVSVYFSILFVSANNHPYIYIEWESAQRYHPSRWYGYCVEARWKREETMWVDESYLLINLSELTYICSF